MSTTTAAERLEMRRSSRRVTAATLRHVDHYRLAWWLASVTTLAVTLQIWLGDRLHEWIF